MTYNCTNVELKLCSEVHSFAYFDRPYNCTNVELKRHPDEEVKS